MALTPVVWRRASSTVTMFWSSMRWRVTIDTELGMLRTSAPVLLTVALLAV